MFIQNPPIFFHPISHPFIFIQKPLACFHPISTPSFSSNSQQYLWASGGGGVMLKNSSHLNFF
jgi:hypothetical protein